jgi:Tol biopolymer transport system component
MRKYFIFYIISSLPGVFSQARAQMRKENIQNNMPVKAPELFAKDVVSTGDDEFGITFTPDEKTCFFAKKTASTITSSSIVICFSRLENGHWTQPAIAPFSGHYKDFNPFITPDGSKLFFISNRPVTGKKTKDADIWFVEKKDLGWSEPINIGAPVNTAGWELGCSVSANGTIYFSAIRENGNADIYSAAYIDGKYTTPERLDSSINSAANESDPFIAPDESYIIFSSLGRADALHSGGADSYPRSDLYISFKKDGKWTTATHLAMGINSEAEESNPYVSSKSGLLFFTSEKNFVTNPMQEKLTYQTLENNLHSIENGLGNIYQVPVNEILLPWINK